MLPTYKKLNSTQPSVRVPFGNFVWFLSFFNFLFCGLLSEKRPVATWNKGGLKSSRFKKVLVIVNVMSLALAGFCFMRQNTRCETGVYTLFALFEYIVVLTNMG